MREQSEAMQALGRAGRRAAYHLLQAVIEGLKAVEAVIEEVGNIGDKNDGDDPQPKRTRIDIE
ncbi:MAG: hypothetical protein ACRDZM_04275 [Acidimicrobiia bacterium]